MVTAGGYWGQNMRAIIILGLLCVAVPALAGEAKPRQCVNSLNARTRMTDSHELIVNGAWRNLANGCPAMAKGASMHIQTSVPQFCQGDILTVFNSSGVGSECTLGLWENIPKDQRER